MDLYKLKYFHVAAETPTFSEAASRCFITQSAMSQSIRQLENSLNAKLFKRSGKNVYLTEEGSILFNHTRNIFNSTEKAISQIKALKQEMKGKIIFGTQASIGVYLLLKPLKKWIKKYAQVNLSMKYQSREGCLSLLREGVIEFAVISSFQKINGYQEISFMKDQWTVVCSADHPLASKKSVKPQDLSKYKLMVPARNNPRQKDYLERVFERAGAYPEINLEANDAETLKHMTLHGFGFSILPRRMIHNELKKGLLKDLHIPGLVVEDSISFVHVKNKPLSFLSQKLIEFLRNNRV